MTDYDVPRFAAASERIGTGAQPTADGIAQIKAAGYDAVVNISTVSAKNFLNREASLTENLELAYVHFPVDCSDLQVHHYEAFSGIMKAFRDKKVFVHCAGNVKSSSLVHMYRVIEEGADEAVSLEWLRQLHEPEQKWVDYFRSHGMKGHVKQRGAA